MLQEEFHQAEHDEEPGPGAFVHWDGKEVHDTCLSLEALHEVPGPPTTLTNRGPGKSSRDRWAATTALPRELSTVAYTDDDAQKTGSVSSTSNSVSEKLSIACVVNPLVEPTHY